MPRYTLEVPKTEQELLERVAAREHVSPRALLVWLLKSELERRLELMAQAAEAA